VLASKPAPSNEAAVTAVNILFIFLTPLFVTPLVTGYAVKLSLTPAKTKLLP
jgi:hypothetical protein